MSIPSATLSSKYQISIPKEVRDAMNFKPGQKLAFLCIGKSIKLVPQMRLEDLFGIGKGADTSGYRDRDTRRQGSWPTLSQAMPELKSKSPAKPKVKPQVNKVRTKKAHAVAVAAA